MPPQQRTFDLIPTTLATGNGYRPPMTSKAAKKAYQQSMRGPRISRAEQRRRDAEELERQRKEFEREKALGRAKAAREKKAAKAEAERQERRKSGLPEPSRYVRPSQPTISRFVRSENGKRTWQEMDTVDEAPEDAVAKHSITTPNEVSKAVAKTAELEEESEDEFGGFPSLSQAEILEKLDGSLPESENSLRQSKPLDQDTDSSHHMSTKPSIRKIVKREAVSDSSGRSVATTDTQLTTKAKDMSGQNFVMGCVSSTHPSALNSTIQETTLCRKEPETGDESLHANLNVKNSAVTTKPAQKDGSLSMPPPKLPMIRNNSSAPTERTSMAQLIGQDRLGLRSYVPSATQAFLEAHFDDFFPSPTQEVRELMEDIGDDDLLSNSQMTREFSLEKSQKSASASRLSPSTTLHTLESASHENEDYFGTLFCTQDLAMSSQELAEITTPNGAPQPFQLGVEHKQEADVRPRSRPGFFEEKEEVIIKSVCQESVKTTIASSSDVKSFSNDEVAPGRRSRFFEEKEEDLIKAAIHESKITAERAIQKAMQKPQRKALLPIPNPNLNSVKPTRNLRRVQSAQSDYDDDDFSGCWQELLTNF